MVFLDVKVYYLYIDVGLLQIFFFLNKCFLMLNCYLLLYLTFSYGRILDISSVILNLPRHSGSKTPYDI